MDTCFSGGNLAIVSGLLGVMATAIGVLFRALLAAKDGQITDLQERLDRALSLTEAGQAVASAVVRRQPRRGG